MGHILNDLKKPLKARFRALFTLRNLGGETAIKEIARCFSDESALLQHELAYCLGQMQDSRAIPYLVRVLEDPKKHPMVRHEAGEALGAIGESELVSALSKYLDDSSVEVAETCHLAVNKIEWASKNSEESEDLPDNPYFSIDPTPPSSERDISCLSACLTDTRKSLWERYRAMFSLRNLGTKDAALALAEGLLCTDSALFRHEIAYVLGQMQSPSVVDHLAERLADSAENCMVRHECAEALGAIGTHGAMEVLRGYLDDVEPVVRESCEIALDMADYENSPEFQYANVLMKDEKNGGCSE